MTNTGKLYSYGLLICLYGLAIMTKWTMAIGEDQDSKRFIKPSISYDDYKRAGQADHMNDLGSQLGSMQRPRYGKRFRIDDGPVEDYVNYEYMDKRDKTRVDLGEALGTIQRPRFGRKR